MQRHRRSVSAFHGLPLCQSTRFTPTFYEGLLLDAPQSAHLRAVINSWLRRQPVGPRRDLIGRLRNPDQAAAALFELITDPILRLLAIDVRREPEDLPCEGKPDYSANLKGKRVVFEVATVETAGAPEEDRREQIVEALRTIEGPIWLSVLWGESRGIETVPLNQIRRRVREALNGLCSDPPQKIAIPFRDCHLVALVWPAKRANKSIIGTGAWRARTSPGIAQIRSRIEEKVARYHGQKEGGIPFATVICTIDPFIDSGSFFDALFGDEKVTLTFENDELLKVNEPVLNDAGSFTPKAKGRQINTSVSAAWFVKLVSIDPVTVKILQARNPWARNRLAWRDSRIGSIGYVRAKGGLRFRRSWETPSLRLEPGSSR